MSEPIDIDTSAVEKEYAKLALIKIKVFLINMSGGYQILSQPRMLSELLIAARAAENYILSCQGAGFEIVRTDANGETTLSVHNRNIFGDAKKTDPPIWDMHLGCVLIASSDDGEKLSNIYRFLGGPTILGGPKFVGNRPVLTGH